jgi:uncharacterized membrane protein YbaN (DUF454 family)
MRWVWFVVGWLAVAVGGVGVVVPGLPTTVFFVVAAWCFARSSPRFERWVLDLPRLGPLVRDHRAGLGMPRRAKAWAVGMMLFFAGSSALFAVDHAGISAVILVLALVGAWYVTWRVPTRERVVTTPAPPVT